MKKTYLKPAIEVTAFVAEDILTTSSNLLGQVLGDGGVGQSDNASSYTTQDSRLAVSGN